MTIQVNFIDRKGFIHFKTGKSRKLVEDWIDLLDSRTSVKWTSNTEVWVSQQYIGR